MSKYKDDNSGLIDKKETEWNAAKASLQRLHFILVDCNESSRSSWINGVDITALTNWRLSLMTLYREISPKLTIEEAKEVDKLFNNINKFPNLQKLIRDPLSDETTIQTSKKGYLIYWNHLHKIEMKLRMFADSKGMLIPNKKDSMDGIMDME